MAEKYGNFELSVYVTTQDLNNLFSEGGRAGEQLAFFQKHLKLSKVYIEYWRAEKTPLDIIEKAKAFFAENGISFATGIMPVAHSKNIGGMFCFSDPATAELYDEIFTTMAKNFDEIMLDDSLATNCTCPLCTAGKDAASKKAGRSVTWAEFRTGLMAEFSKKHIADPARAANPNVRITIKYPTWHESFQWLGYNTKEQTPLFEESYSGTETRHTTYSIFRNPRYTSYSLLRYLQSVPPHNNRGAWFDAIQCANDIGIYLEQAELSLLGAPKEITLFCWGLMSGLPQVGALGIMLEKLDAQLGKLGKPAGIPVYLPHFSSGEDHVYDFLGMCGIPFEPVAEFPTGGETVLLTAASALDKELYAKVRAHCEGGGDAVFSAGFLQAVQDTNFSDFTGMRVTGRSQLGAEFGGFDTAWSADTEYARAAAPISLPVIDWMTNEVVFIAMQMRESMPNVLLAHTRYGNGRVFVLNVPDSFADFYEIPPAVMGYIRKYISKNVPVRIEGDNKVALFTRDADAFALRSFNMHGSVLRVCIKGQAAKLRSLTTGRAFAPLYSSGGETVFRVPAQPNMLELFAWDR